MTRPRQGKEKAVSNGHIEGPSNKGGDLMETLGYGGGPLKSKDVFKTWYFGWQKKKSKGHREIKYPKKLSVWRRGAALGISLSFLLKRWPWGRYQILGNLCTFWGQGVSIKGSFGMLFLCLTVPIHGGRGYNAHDVSGVIT